MVSGGEDGVVVPGGDDVVVVSGGDDVVVVSGGDGVVVVSGGNDVVVVSGGDAVMTVSGGQELVPWNVTSARYVQLEPGGGMNSRPTTGGTMFCDMHILTRESHEVMGGTVNVLTTDLLSHNDRAARSLIV